MASDKENAQWKRFLTTKRPTIKGARLRARKLEGATVRHAHRFVVSRWTNFRYVRRHAIGWILLASLLVLVTMLQLFWIKDAYVVNTPVPGGVYAEGVPGRIDTLNPIHATTQAERSAGVLLFSSLLRYDAQDNLENDLATGYKTSKKGKVYTVKIREDATWHDGEPVTGDDVMYTLDLIKNPLVRSYLYRTWQDIAVKQTDKYTIVFTLPSAYVPFPHALTFPVLPKHVLVSTAPARIRESTFSRDPIGSGPFTFRALQPIDPSTNRAVLQTARNTAYYRGAVKLDRFQLHTYKDHEALRQGFLSREINAAQDLTAADIQMIQEAQPSTQVANALLRDGVYAFFRTDNTILSDVDIRRALVVATDRKAVIESLHGLAGNLNGPLLDSQTDGIKNLKQAPFSQQKAAKMLEKAGWKLKDGVRTKKNKTLQLTLVAPESGDFPTVLKMIEENWKAIGIDVTTELIDPSRFEQDIVKPRSYDVLLYELALGADPDVFAYWHSSQASIRGFNLSNYSSGIADDALISARSRSEPILRKTKYISFVKQWINDAPAVALYQPRLHYVITDGTSSLSRADDVVDTLNRYYTIDQWTVATDDRFKTP